MPTSVLAVIGTLGGAVLTCGNVYAQEKKINCPETISREAITLSRAPEGWTPYTDSIFRLRSIGMMSGPPDSLQELVPDGGKQGKTIQTFKWSFQPKDEKWISCKYGLGGEMSLSKKIEEDMSECVVTYLTDKHGETTIQFKCKPN
ncbi:MAG: STY0301 family protein [Pseudomonadota bacterium]